MIIDVHYHIMPRLPKAAAEHTAQHAIQAAKIMRKKINPETIVKKAIDTWEDPTGDRLLAAMEESGVDLTVICMVDNASNPALKSENMQRGNKIAADIAQKYPDRVMALAGIDPRRPEAPDMMRQCLEEYGMKGLKYHPDNGYHPAGPESYEVLKVLVENNGILLTHTSPLPPPSQCKFAEPGLLADLAVDFPDLKVIAAHMGYVNWRPWAALALHQPNLYGDLAMWVSFALGNYERFCHELRAIIDYAGVSKILFGTDDPIYNTIAPTKDWIKLLRDLPENAPEGIIFTDEEITAILGGNAAILLGLASA